MAQSTENLDFSGLFKLDVLIHLDISTHSFYEIGLNKFLALSSGKELVFLYINSLSERIDKVYDWDFLDNPVHCMCFEPSGTWVLIVSDQKILLVPFLPLFSPQNVFDCKWSLSSVTVLPLLEGTQPTSVVWWLTKESENIIIIGSQSGIVTFYSLESQCVVAETKVPGEINDLQICFDDSLDLLALLISNGPTQQWKLVLEHRSFSYNWLQQMRAQCDKEKKDGFMSYIKQLSKDKITFFTQIGSKDENKSQTVEYALKPVEYLPKHRKGTNNWALTAQYVNGRHCLTAFELNEGAVILDSPAEGAQTTVYEPEIKNDGLFIQGLWSQRILYLLRKNEVEVHSANLSICEGYKVISRKRDPTELWSVEVIGDIQRGYVMSAKEPQTMSTGWKEPTFICDLQIPRFAIEPCLVITSCGAYIVNTVGPACEWVVGLIVRGGAGAERAAEAVGAPLPPLLAAAADLLMSRGKVPPAHELCSLAQVHTDGWIARLGAFGRLHELSMYKLECDVGSLGNSAKTAKLLASLLKCGTNSEECFELDVKLTNLGSAELQELTSISLAIGLWDLAPMFSIYRGQPNLFLSALKSRSDICRGALICLLKHQCLVPYLLEDNGQWLFDFITEKCKKFDTVILKRLCLWLNPLQDQLRPVMRDLKQGITSIYATRMLQLIATFMQTVCALEARIPCVDIKTDISPESETWKNHFVPKRSLSCGLVHWAVVDDGNARVMMADTPVNTELIGKVLDVACGRHHTLILTENGVYGAGDNTFGQLGVGARWAGPGGTGGGGGAGGALVPAARGAGAPLVAVAAGHYHSAAIDAGGRLYTWGWGVHGQLCLGNIDTQLTPQLVTKLQGRKVLNVGCGACHTVVLMMNGEVWASGAAVFGQLGNGSKVKSSLPVKVLLPDPIEQIAVGYFHNLGLSSRGQVWVWGASPQQLRASQPRKLTLGAEPEHEAPPPDHMLPRPVDTAALRGPVVQMSAGWHHSCLLDNTGTMYSWGLNFDGQLGTGGRKQLKVPTPITICTDSQPDNAKGKATTPTNESEVKTKALVACGGDFTIYIDDDGRIYSTGNTHVQVETTKKKIITMKTTKRVIKIPTPRGGNKFMFQPVDRIDIMFPFDVDDLDRKPMGPRLNPLTSIRDFKKKSWADDMILLLNPWINEETLNGNLNMAAKLAYHRKQYSDSLKLLLENLKHARPTDQLYLTHHEDVEDEKNRKKDDQKIIVTNIMSKRIKDISISILNEEPFPIVDTALYQTLPCCCDELKYTRKIPSSSTVISEMNLSLEAAQVIDRCISIFPVNSALWETCFKLSKDFYIDNHLVVEDLERVLVKYMEANATTMAAAIMYSKDCAQYTQILTPRFYLNMCSDILDAWT